MTDLVARLRKLNPCGEPLLLHDDAIIAQAADEIDRLRNQIEAMRAVISADHQRPAPVSDREIREFHRRLMAMGGVPGRIWEE